MGEIVGPIVSEIVHDSIVAMAQFIGCYLSQLFFSPVSFVNHVFCGIIDAIALIMPETPDDLKISALAYEMANDNPLGWFVGGRLLLRVFPLLGLLLIVKGFKLWRP